MHLTSKQQKYLKWVGYPLLAIVVFIFSLAYTFPYERLKGKIVENLSQQYNASIVSIEPSWVPGTFTIHNMVLATRPVLENQKPIVIAIDSAEVDVGVISAVFWAMNVARLKINVEALVASGSLSAVLQHDKGDRSVEIEARVDDLPIDSIPSVAEAVGLPMTGRFTAGLELLLPGGKWADADGDVTFTCLDCTVGDGKAQIEMKPPLNKRARLRAMKIDKNLKRLTVPRIKLGIVDGTISIEEGKGEIKNLSAKSGDGHLRISGVVDFKDPFKETLFPGCMRFSFSDELKEREPTFMGIQASLPPKSRQPDGSYAIPTIGKLMDLRFNIKKQCTDDVVGSQKGTTSPSRPRPSVSRIPPPKRPRPTRRQPSSNDDDDSDKTGAEIVPKSGKGVDVEFGDKKTREQVAAATRALTRRKDGGVKSEPTDDPQIADGRLSEDQDEDQDEDRDEDQQISEDGGAEESEEDNTEVEVGEDSYEQYERYGESDESAGEE